MMMPLLLALLAGASPLPSGSPSPPALPRGCSAATAFTGTICTPATSGKHPALLLLGGSEGGEVMGRVAPRFSARGFVAASVAYFNAPGLPATLQLIPVETVGRALKALVARPDVDSNHIGILGVSKGGEFALLAASTYQQIHAVVAVVPSPFAWEGIAQGPSQPVSSWSLDGLPVPFVAYAPAMGAIFGQAFGAGTPLDLRPGYDASMQQNAAQIPAATFHLERIKGPVMMLAAGDDQIWDSVAQCRVGIKYLRDHGHPYPDAFLQYPQAGHLFLFASPGHPMTQSPLGPIALLLGGTERANIQAAGEAWPRIFAFLDAALK